MEFIKNQEWRYATKTFDANKKVSAENIELLKKSIQLSVSSFGLQLYKVLIINNKEIREQLKPASWNQSQITDASHLFVICSYSKFDTAHVDQYINLTANTRNIDIENISGYAEFMKGAILNKNEDEQKEWMKNQTYIAMTNLLAACAELKIDACPMEGFDPEKYNEILDLNSKQLSASLVIPVGYRSEKDITKDLAKVRKSEEDLFITL